MGKVSTMMINVLVVLCLFGEAFSKTKKHHEEISTEFDFFYFVQQVRKFHFQTYYIVLANLFFVVGIICAIFLCILFIVK